MGKNTYEHDKFELALEDLDMDQEYDSDDEHGSPVKIKKVQNASSSSFSESEYFQLKAKFELQKSLVQT